MSIPCISITIDLITLLDFLIKLTNSPRHLYIFVSFHITYAGDNKNIRKIDIVFNIKQSYNIK